MLINRRNILELIGKDRRRYHSCIITCYSFNFQFFEERVMRVLRTANIRNVSVFMDGNFLEHTLENTTGREFRNFKAYGINPIYTSGVFHPKIMLLSGARHGLLLIGSGNLTSSGLSTNDEVWGAFHMDSIEGPNAVLFGKVWRYLQSFFSQVKGFNIRKLEWLRRHSPWIDQLMDLGGSGFDKISNRMEIGFLASHHPQSIYRQLLTLLPAEPPSKLTIIGPYYDKQGKLLTAFSRNLNPERYSCIVDTEYGLLPLETTEEVAEKIQFVDWQDCVKEFDYKYNRLHAKIFHFKYPGEEYLLLGSANASIQAFGSKEAKGINHEAAILLKRSGKTNYLTDLGVRIPEGKELSLAACSNTSRSPGETRPFSQTKVKIIYAEIDASKLTFFVSKPYSEPLILVVGNEFDEAVERRPIPEIDPNGQEVSLSKPDEAFKIYLENAAGYKVSNFMLIHQVAMQAKCNPDPKLQKLDELMDRVYDYPDEVSKLLEHVDYTWIDDEEENTANTYRSGGMAIKSKKIDKIERDFEQLDEASFNKISADRLFQQEFINNTSVRIADFLSSLKSGFSKLQEESFEDNEEQALLETSMRTGEGEDVEQESNRFSDGKNEEATIKRFFRKLDRTYKENLKSFYKSKEPYDLRKKKISLRALSNLLIGLEVLEIFYGRTYQTRHNVFSIITEREHLKKIGAFERQFKLNRLKRTHPDFLHVVYYSVQSESLKKLIQTGEKEEYIKFHNDPVKEPLIKDHQFIETGKTGDDCTSIKGFLNRILGQFLILATGGIKSYEYDVVNQKVRTNRENIFEAAVFLILNLYWSSREEIARNILLLDLLRYINPAEWEESRVNRFKERLNKRKENAKVISNSLEKNIAFFINYLLPAYKKWRNILEDKNNKKILEQSLTSLGRGNIVYDQKIGFCEFISCKRDKITISKPGFQFDKKINSGLLKDVRYSKNSIAVWPK